MSESVNSHDSKSDLCAAALIFLSLSMPIICQPFTQLSCSICVVPAEFAGHFINRRLLGCQTGSAGVCGSSWCSIAVGAELCLSGTALYQTKPWTPDWKYHWKKLFA